MENKKISKQKIYLEGERIVYEFVSNKKFYKTFSTNGKDFFVEEKKNFCEEKEKVLGYEKFVKLSSNKFVSYAESFEGIKVFLSQDKKDWIEGEIEFKPRKQYFDNTKLYVGFFCEAEEGIILFYYTKFLDKYFFGCMVFDKEEPEKILYRSLENFWSVEVREEFSLSGVAFLKNKLFVYFGIGEEVKMFQVPFSFCEDFGAFEKHDEPIIMPNDNCWENVFTFNAATFEHDGEIHILYRAIGNDNISTLGYAKTKCGIKIYERSKSPVYTHKISGVPVKDVASAYISGGHYFKSYTHIGGCEDPKIVKIDDRLYMTYCAFEGYPRIAFTSIKVSDFLKGKMNWEEPELSPPGVIQKNWLAFPEKINGKYAILHSITSEILIDYRDEMSFQNLNSHYLLEERDEEWHYMVRGPGAPPIKTEKGWLLFYHGHTRGQYGKYKIGAMLLDLKDPTKILYKSSNPVLIPDRGYEISGFKPGVVYCCGATVLNETLFIYYGAGDHVLCVAKQNLNKFLDLIINNKVVENSSVEVIYDER